MIQAAFRLFEEPHGDTFRLTSGPRLESWDASSHPAQMALQSYLDEVQELLATPLEGTGTDLAIELTVGLDDALSLTRGGRDLDNYLCPVVRRLGPSRFATAWARKVHGDSSYVTIGPAIPAEAARLTGWTFGSAECSTSAQSTSWKEAIAAQVTGPRAEGQDAVEMQIALRVGNRRNWVGLWKPAIDALGGVLGLEHPQFPFRPRDDRIVRLGLHREVDVSLGDRVQLGVWWKPASRGKGSTRLVADP